ncbi:flagellar export chaperone FliS [Aquimonas sp.]|jgi:flagellar protein FliS|uniref:flagellar export chaperone FliS n=1 Tax=Aquimonas sp. TaxID=1872588 RepID=UPI0037BFDAAC
MHSARAFLKEYRNTGLEGSVIDASPHRLIGLLLQGARERIQLAAAALSEGRTGPKGEAIGRACAIIDSLRGSLDHAAGGEIAGGLEALYDYATRRLVEANAINDPTGFTEVDALLAEVQAAWAAIPAQLQAQPA